VDGLLNEWAGGVTNRLWSRSEMGLRRLNHWRNTLDAVKRFRR
jgi:hypothetical protein